MARRTGEQATVSTLHGHYDGPRGHQDEHDHPGGDRAHPHHNDSTLDRSAELLEYVPLARLPKARAAAAEDWTATLANDDTVRIRAVASPNQPPPTTELVTRNGDQADAKDATVASFVTRLANLAGHERWADLYTYETRTLIALGELAEAAERNLAARKLVDPKFRNDARELFEDWDAKHGVRDGGS